MDREKIEAKAKELGITLSDEDIQKHLDNDTLPEKKPEKNGDPDTKDKDNTVIREMRKQIKKQQDVINSFNENQKKANEDKLKKDGELQKIIDTKDEDLEKAKGKITSIQEKFKTSIINQNIESKLIKEGVLVDKLPKALKLIDKNAIEFEFADDEKLDYTINGIDGAFDDFKKDFGDVFIGEKGADSDDSKSKDPEKRKHKKTDDEKKAEENKLKSKFSALL